MENLPADNVAEIEDGLEDVRRIARVQGKPSVGLGIKKQRGANLVDIAKKVKAKMESMKSGSSSRLAVDFEFRWNGCRSKKMFMSWK